MKFAYILTLVYISSVSASSLLQSTPEYASWSPKELKNWLDAHGIDIPDRASTDDLKTLVESNWNSAFIWTQDQYDTAQKVFGDIREQSFEKWDDSKLRQFLLEQGISAPNSPREHLLLLAKSKYRSWSNTANLASNTVSAYVTQATDTLSCQLEDSKDYVYSLWSDSELRRHLLDRGLIQESAKKSRDELLAIMRDAYTSIADPIWTAWSDSYIHEWLVSHNIIRPDEKKATEILRDQMTLYFYDPKAKVYDLWDDATLKQWLVAHNIIATEETLPRDRLLQLVRDNYLQMTDIIWSSWSDWDLRQWLIQNGYLRSDAQRKRDDLITIINEKHKDAVRRPADYLIWPDSRLRTFLREAGVPDASLPLSRSGLLQETRIRWVDQAKLGDMFDRTRASITSAVQYAKEKLQQVYVVLSQTW